EREWLVPFRSTYRRLPFYQSMYRHLRGVIAGSRHAAAEIPRWFHGRRFYLPENGIDPSRFPIPDRWSEPGHRFRFITVGRLVPVKGIDLILEAIGRSKLLRECEMTIVGDGPHKPMLEKIVARSELDRVQFVGWLDQGRLAAQMRASQAFVFPSLRDFGGG